MDSQRQYAEVRELGERVRDDALARLNARMGGELVVRESTDYRV